MHIIQCMKCSMDMGVPFFNSIGSVLNWRFILDLRMLTICKQSVLGGCLLSFLIALLYYMFGSE